jgi:hypothetical protein
MSIILVKNSKHKNSNKGDSESTALLLKMLHCTMYETPDGAWKLQLPSSHHHRHLQGLGLLDRSVHKHEASLRSESKVK